MGAVVTPYGGGAAGTMRPRSKKPEDDVFGDVGAAQGYLREGVEGYGEQLRPGLLKEIGSTLGGLNAIGGLRSGGVPVALGDIASQYGAQVGAYAKEATGEGLRLGLEAHKQRFEEAEAKRRRKAGILHAIGMVLGAGIGFAASGGNPKVAALGANIGGSAGSAVGGGGGGDETYAGGH